MFCNIDGDKCFSVLRLWEDGNSLTKIAAPVDWQYQFLLILNQCQRLDRTHLPFIQGLSHMPAICCPKQLPAQLPRGDITLQLIHQPGGCTVQPRCHGQPGWLIGS